MYWLCVLAVIMELAFYIQHSQKERGSQVEANRTNDKIKLVPQAWFTSGRIERLESGILTEKSKFLLYNVGDGTLLTYKAVKVSGCFYRTESVMSNNNLFRPNDYLLVSAHQNLQHFTSVVWKATVKGPTVLIEPAPPWESLWVKSKSVVNVPSNNQWKQPISPSQNKPGTATTTVAKNSQITVQKPTFTRVQAVNNQYFGIPQEQGLRTVSANQAYNYDNSRNQNLQSRKLENSLRGPDRIGCPSLEWSFVWGIVSSTLSNSTSKHRWYQIRNFNGNCLKSGATFVPCRLPNSLVIFEILKLV